MSTHFDTDRDLTISRVIRAPRALTWRAFAEPELFAKWWVPAPTTLDVLELSLRPGGAMRTEMRNDGGVPEPHMHACILDVEPQRRLVFTTALQSAWRPAPESAIMITAVLTLEDHPDGTLYSAHVMHRDAAARQVHETLGFTDGWGTVAAQLAALVEGMR